jgi:hypothetical protein
MKMFILNGLNTFPHFLRFLRQHKQEKMKTRRKKFFRIRKGNGPRSDVEQVIIFIPPSKIISGDLADRGGGGVKDYQITLPILTHSHIHFVITF